MIDEPLIVQLAKEELAEREQYVRDLKSVIARVERMNRSAGVAFEDEERSAVGQLKSRATWLVLFAQAVLGAILGCAFFPLGFTVDEYLIVTAALIVCSWLVFLAHVGVAAWIRRQEIAGAETLRENEPESRS